jgi:hypothetical protein
MLPPKWKMLLTCQWQMSQAEERRRLFEDKTGRNFGQHAGETAILTSHASSPFRATRFERKGSNIPPAASLNRIDGTFDL